MRRSFFECDITLRTNEFLGKELMSVMLQNGSIKKNLNFQLDAVQGETKMQISKITAPVFNKYVDRTLSEGRKDENVGEVETEQRYKQLQLTCA